MPRMRTIKPDFFKDEDIACLPMACRLFYAGLWCQADREGRLEYRPKRLKVEIMPFDAVSIEDLCKTLITPNIPHRPEKSFITIYEHNGQQYLQILNFTKHQRTHHLEKPSAIPAPPNQLNNNNTCKQPSNDRSTTVEQPSQSAGFLVLGSGNGNGNGLPPQSQNAFQKVCELYPIAGQQVGIADGQAELLFSAEVVVSDHGPFLQAVKNYTASDQVRDGYVRQIINFIRAGYWRNWTSVKPSGASAEHIPDKAWEKERAEALAAIEADRKAGKKIDFSKRPAWTH